MPKKDLKGGEGAPEATVAGVKEPHRVAIIQDWGVGIQPIYDQYDATRLAFEEATSQGILDRPVEIKIVEAEGLPYRRFSSLLRAVREVVEEWDPIALIGPHQSENTVAIRNYIEGWRIPVIAMSGTMDFAGEYSFLTPNGTFGDEAPIMVDWLREQGVKNLAVLREDNVLGDEYAAAIRLRARRLKIRLAADVVLPTFMSEQEAGAAIDSIREHGADGYAYVGFGATSVHVLKASRSAAQAGWDPPRITMSIYMGSIKGLSSYGQTPEAFEGWAGIDQYDETNPAFMTMLDRFEQRFGRRPVHCYTAQGYDMGNLLAHGLALAKPVSRAGLRKGLERVRRLPATVGGPGTVMGLGPYDHRAYKGPFITLRRMRNGVNELIGSR